LTSGYDAKKVGGNVVVKENKRRRTKLEKAVEGKGKPMEHTQEAVEEKGRDASGEPKKGGDFGDIMNGIKSAAGTVGEVVKTAAAVAPYVAPLVGLGKKREPTEWMKLVHKVRKEKGLEFDPDFEIHQRAQPLHEERGNSSSRPEDTQAQDQEGARRLGTTAFRRRADRERRCQTNSSGRRAASQASNTHLATNRQICMEVQPHRQQKLESQERKKFEIISSS
jgi:hypothetical protein